MSFTLQGYQSLLMSFGETVKVNRAVDIYFVDGKPVTNDSRCFFIRASVQPLSGRELTVVPEGDRLKNQVWVYTSSQIYVNDILTYNDVRYQAQTVEEWPGYCKSRAVRIDVGENASP